jgi:hypothetical protein
MIFILTPHPLDQKHEVAAICWHETLFLARLNAMGLPLGSSAGHEPEK